MDTQTQKNIKRYSTNRCQMFLLYLNLSHETDRGQGGLGENLRSFIFSCFLLSHKSGNNETFRK